MQCSICENACNIVENQTGFCGMYTNRDQQLVEKYPDHYLVAVSSEIESMPMTHYHPGSKFLQICTIGCNFRCSGCVSWILTEKHDYVHGALHRMSPEAVIQKALDEGCRGIMFCFNEPAVSFLTFMKVAALAKKHNLLVGCATNAYFSETAFRELLRHIDFINIGIKGCTDSTYSQFGVSSVSPVLRNLRLSVESGVFTEVAAVYVKGFEAEVRNTAKFVASLSQDIPFQVMRFISLAGADSADEPSILDSEKLCDELRESLRYVYLFNSPGTSYLNTECPECGEMLVRRGFNGPMCAHVAEARAKGRCSCGFQPPLVGAFEKDSGAQVLGFYGGYKTIHCLESIQGVLAFLGEKDPGVIASVLQKILETDFIKGLYERTKRIDSYLDTVDHYARLAGRMEEASRLRGYIGNYVSVIRRDAAKASAKPRVYCSLGHPLLAIFGDKFECNLVGVAGGRCVNVDIQREGTPGLTIPEESLRKLDPDIILINQSMGYSVNDFYQTCEKCGLDIQAVQNRRIYNLHPYSTAGRPDWILGLMQMANILHPEIFHFDMDTLADEFYKSFLSVPFQKVRQKKSITHPSQLEPATLSANQEESKLLLADR